MDRMNTTFEKIRRVPNYQVLAEAIAAQVLDGRLPEGSQLPTEAKLCEAFGVNRSTVREGMRVLEEANLIRRDSPKRLVITKPSRKQIGDQLSRALVLHQISFRELWESMNAIEPPMAALAASRVADEDLRERLRSNLESTRAAVASGEPLVDLDIEFHDIVAAMSGNRALRLAREPLGRLFFPTFEAVLSHVPAAGKRLYDAHKQIGDSILQRNPAGAQQWMEKHIRDFKRGYEQVAKFDIDAPVPWRAPGGVSAGGEPGQTSLA